MVQKISDPGPPDDAWLIRKVTSGYNLYDKDTRVLLKNRSLLSTLFNTDFTNQLTAGRTWREWVKFVGSMSVDAKILLPAEIGLKNHAAKFTLGYDGDMFGNLSGDLVQDDRILVEGGVYDGLKGTWSTATNDCFAGIWRHFQVKSVKVYRFAGFGFHFWSVDVDNRSEGEIGDYCWIGHDNAAYVNGGGAWMEHAGFAVTDFEINDSFWINNGTSPFLKLDIGCGKDSVVSRNHVAGNVNGAKAIYGASSVHDLQIIENHFEFIKRNAIYFYTASNGEYVLGNVIKGNTFRDCCYEADNTYDTVYLGVDGVTTAVARGNVVVGNMFRVDGSANRARYLVHLDSANADSNTVVGNTGTNSQSPWNAPYGTAGCQDDGTNEVAHNMWA